MIVVIALSVALSFLACFFSFLFGFQEGGRVVQGEAIKRNLGKYEDAEEQRGFKWNVDEQ